MPTPKLRPPARCARSLSRPQLAGLRGSGVKEWGLKGYHPANGFLEQLTAAGSLHLPQVLTATAWLTVSLWFCKSR